MEMLLKSNRQWDLDMPGNFKLQYSFTVLDLGTPGRGVVSLTP
jgi:hypothetical protein